MIKITKELLKQEKRVVTARRIKGSKILRPSTILLVFITFLYYFSPVDILPDKLLPGYLGYFDDIALALASAVYVALDITYALGGVKQGEDIRTAELDEDGDEDDGGDS